MSQIGQPMKTTDLYDQPPPPAASVASAAPPPPANDQLYEQPPLVDDGKQSTARTKSEEVQRPTKPPRKPSTKTSMKCRHLFWDLSKKEQKHGKTKGKEAWQV
ncbi:unnamed protein product [Meloidogyne enterolobii]|uniref:Uncharacterized protein n=1 Tax=Meloidogyne enterolobii TaxID=390850 RepID=A0ACB1ANF9_MELEN